jgi:hypothetical protein
MPQRINALDGLNIGLGRAGSTFINTTGAKTGSWAFIIVIADCVFTTLTDANRDGDAVGSTSFAAGTMLFGTFTAITLASGSVVAYKDTMPGGSGSYL